MRKRAIAQIAHDGHDDGADGIAIRQHEHEQSEQRPADIGAIRFDAEDPPRPQRCRQNDDQQDDGDVEHDAPAPVGHDARGEAHAPIAEEEVRDIARRQIEREVEQVVSPEARSGSHADAQRVGQGGHAYGRDELDDPALFRAETGRPAELVDQKHVDHQEEQNAQRVVRAHGGAHGFCLLAGCDAVEDQSRAADIRANPGVIGKPAQQRETRAAL